MRVALPLLTARPPAAAAAAAAGSAAQRQASCSAAAAAAAAGDMSHPIDDLDDSLSASDAACMRQLSAGDSIPEENEEMDIDEIDGVVAAKASPHHGGGHHVHHRSGRSGSQGSGSCKKLQQHHQMAAAAAAVAARKACASGRDRAYSTCEDGRFGGGVTAEVLAKVDKNSRKSRSGLGRGLPKKGGAGGKGTWGKPGCELDLAWVDPNDPNYASDDEQPVAVGGGQRHASGGGDLELRALVPEMSADDVTRSVTPLVLEYFENGDCAEVVASLQEMLGNLAGRRWMVVALLIEAAFDHKPSHREMASYLLSELYTKVTSQRDIGKAFDHLLRQLPDLILDTPDAPEVLGNFLARAIADDCIPPRFLHSYRGQPHGDEAAAALRRADTLLSMRHGMVRLDDVWGVGVGGVRPVKTLVKRIVLLLKEYTASGDAKEAERCLRELEVPHFHHELVYEAAVMAIESMNEKTEADMCRLLSGLFRSFVITIEQMKKGFVRVFENLADISLDVPAADQMLERFVGRCREAGLVTDEIVRKMPPAAAAASSARGRKRFVSEGDGCLAKPHLW